MTINGRRYMDGGVGSTNNADLTTGHHPVVILAPYPAGLSASLDEEIRSLGDSTVVIVAPNRDALEAIGPNPLDAARRGVALDAGLSQAGNELDRIREAWGRAGGRTSDRN